MKSPIVLFVFFIFVAMSCKSADKQVIEPEESTSSESLTYLALGDSYTIGESVAETGRYPVQLVEALREQEVDIADPWIIARTGWTTDELQTAIAEQITTDTVFDLVSLLIGVNNQYRGRSVDVYAQEFEELLNYSIVRAGGNRGRVFVVSIPDYGFTPFAQNRGDQAEISKGIDEFNAVSRRITEAAGVKYLDITPISRRGLEQPDLVASDGLHPSAKQYGLWVEEVLAVASGVPALLGK